MIGAPFYDPILAAASTTLVAYSRNLKPSTRKAPGFSAESSHYLIQGAGGGKGAEPWFFSPTINFTSELRCGQTVKLPRLRPFLALSAQISRTSVCPLLDQSGQRLSLAHEGFVR
jgi:hypothetical protein